MQLPRFNAASFVRLSLFVQVIVTLFLTYCNFQMATQYEAAGYSNIPSDGSLRGSAIQGRSSGLGKNSGQGARALKRLRDLGRELERLQQELGTAVQAVREVGDAIASGADTGLADVSDPSTKAYLSQQQGSFDFDVNGSRGVGILIVVDYSNRQKLAYQLTAMQCYARYHGYRLDVIGPHTGCLQINFFFVKHCTVANFLQRQQEGYTAFVMDGDVIPVVMQRGLDAWISPDEDLVFYEREWSPEVAAGNYIARNSAFSKAVLNSWANFEQVTPSYPVFTGHDNGALHAVIAIVLNLPCAAQVVRLFTGLSHKGINASDVTRIPMEYKHFIAAAEMARGPPRRWVNASHGGASGNLTILPRLHAWVVDSHATLSKGCVQLGSIFHHGVKSREDVVGYFASDADLIQCKLRADAFVEPQVYAATTFRYVQAVTQTYGGWHLPSGRPVPFHEAYMHCCLRLLACRPLGPREVFMFGANRIFADPLAAGAPAGDQCFKVPAEPPVQLLPCNWSAQPPLS